MRLVVMASFFSLASADAFSFAAGKGICLNEDESPMEEVAESVLYSWDGCTEGFKASRNITRAKRF